MTPLPVSPDPAPATAAVASAIQSANLREVAAAPAVAIPAVPPPSCFVTWLRAQGKSGGAIGELAKAARLDPMFPKTGSPDMVRTRFSQVGADGDAYAALEDAERAYDRLE